MPGRRDLLRLLQLESSSPVLLLKGTSFDQDGAPVEIFSTWHHPNHFVFDIGIQQELTTPASFGGPASSPAGDAPDAPDAVWDRARQLAANLLRFADQVEISGPLTPTSCC